MSAAPGAPGPRGRVRRDRAAAPQPSISRISPTRAAAAISSGMTLRSRSLSYRAAFARALLVAAGLSVFSGCASFGSLMEAPEVSVVNLQPEASSGFEQRRPSPGLASASSQPAERLRAVRSQTAPTKPARSVAVEARTMR